MADELKVFTVYSQLRGMRGDDPGHVVAGYYIVDDSTVTLTNEAGTPVPDRMGKLYSYKLKANDTAHSHAARLNKQRWLSSRGHSDFTRPLNYPKTGIY